MGRKGKLVHIWRYLFNFAVDQQKDLSSEKEITLLSIGTNTLSECMMSNAEIQMYPTHSVNVDKKFCWRIWQSVISKHTYLRIPYLYSLRGKFYLVQSNTMYYHCNEFDLYSFIDIFDQCNKWVDNFLDTSTRPFACTSAAAQDLFSSSSMEGDFQLSAGPWFLWVINNK